MSRKDIKVLKKTGGLQKVKRRRKIVLLVVGFSLAGLIAYSVLKPDPEEEEFDRLKGLMISRQEGKLDPGQRDDRPRPLNLFP